MNKPWRRVEVHGDSMRPTLVPGDRLLVLRLPVRVGHLVAVRTPERVVVKRVVRADRAAATVDVAGDNKAASTDYGGVARKDVLGRVVYRYAPEGRVGRVGRPH